MSLLRSSCLLAVTMMILAAKLSSSTELESGERVKRQTIIRFPSTGSSINSIREFTFILDGQPTVILNDPNIDIIDIGADETVRFAAGAVITRNTSSGAPADTTSGVTNFVFADENNVVTTPPTLPETNGPGILYLQAPNALFSKSDFVNDNIMRTIPALPAVLIPPDPIEIELVPRTGARNFIALNIDTTEVPDGTSEPADDVIELTGSMSFSVSSGQTVTYGGDQLLVRTRSVIDEMFQDVRSFSVLEPTVQSGIAGFRYRVFNATTGPSPALSGPASLTVGMQGGQRVAFFSSDANENTRIATALVDMQLNFRVMNDSAEIVARFPPAISGNSLITLNGAQSFNFPNAAAVRRMGNVVSVLDGFGRTLQSFDTGSPITVSSFLNNQVQRSMADGVFEIPDGGATLFFNPRDNEMFLYPSENQIVGGNINQAIQDANIMQPVQIASYSLSADEFGVGTLSARVQNMDMEVVNVAPATVVDLGSRDSILYQGMMLEVMNRDGATTREFTVSPLTVNLAGAQYLSSDNSFPTTFGGPGRLYVDSEMRAFFTKNPDIQNFITNFVIGIPEPRIDVTRDADDGLIYFRTGGENLFNLNGAGAVTAGNGMTGIYSDNAINLVNVFNVPANARASFNMAGDVVRVADPNDPDRFLFQTSAGMLYDIQQDGTIRLTPKDSDLDFDFMNGNIYFSDRGALVTVNDDINDGITNILFNSGNLEASTMTISGIMNFTVANGRSIITYMGMAPSALPTGGTYYTSSTGGSAMYIANQGFNDRVPGIYSQFNPSVSVYNSTTGVITIMTAEGQFISSLQPGVTPTMDIMRATSILYVNETLFFSPEIVQPLEMINQFVVWDGLMATTYNRSNDDIRFEGPGVFWYEGDTAFFTADPVTARNIRQRIRNVINTFRVPIIRQDPRVFKSKFRNIRGGFPQTIELYEGANVMLPCVVSASNPPSMIGFYRRFFNATSQEFENVLIMDGDDNYRIVQTGNNVSTLLIDIIRADDNINAYNNTGVFTCVVENIMGSSSVSTTINVRPPQPPAIVNGFIPPLDTLRNSSGRLYSILGGLDGDGNHPGDSLTTTPRRPIVFGTVNPQFPIADDGLTIVRKIHIGCKSEGLPKSEINWYQVDSGADFNSPDLNSFAVFLNPINDTERDDVMITVPREGRSVLNIELSPTDTTCQRYICEAFNLAGTVRGGIDVCPEHFFCEGPIQENPCPVTCGFGLTTQFYSTCTRFSNDMNTVINYTQVPSTLYPLGPALCGETNPPCPVITYRYDITNVTDCSVTCGIGSIMRTVECRQYVNGVVNATVNDTFCAGQFRPSDFMTCRNPPCPFWRIGTYGPCSATCRGGMRTRSVACVQPGYDNTTMSFEILRGENSTETEIDDQFCMGGPISRPFDTTPCNYHIACPFRWRPQPWGPCSDRFPGCQERDIVCENWRLSDPQWPGDIVNDSYCEDRGFIRPHGVRSCKGGICSEGMWQTDPGACSTSCGRGFLSQNVSCHNTSTNEEIEFGYCDLGSRPGNVVPCPPPRLNCPGQCDFEPAACPLVRLLGCEMDDLRPIAIRCCKSCPKQATPITLPPTEAPMTTVVGPTAPAATAPGATS